MRKANMEKLDIRQINSGEGYTIKEGRNDEGGLVWDIGLNNVTILVKMYESSGKFNIEFVGSSAGYDSIMVRACDIIFDSLRIPIDLRKISRRHGKDGHITELPVMETDSPYRYKFLGSVSRNYPYVRPPSSRKLGPIDKIVMSELYTVKDIGSSGNLLKYEITVKGSGMSVHATGCDAFMGLVFKSINVEADRLMVRVCDAIHDVAGSGRNRIITRTSENGKYCDDIPRGVTDEQDRYSNIEPVPWGKESRKKREEAEKAMRRMSGSSMTVTDRLDDSCYTVTITDDAPSGKKKAIVWVAGAGLYISLDVEPDGTVEASFFGGGIDYNKMMVRVCDILLDSMGIEMDMRRISRKCTDTYQAIPIPVKHTYSNDRFGFMATNKSMGNVVAEDGYNAGPVCEMCHPIPSR